MSCLACHSAPPVLNELGQRFRENNRLDNWREAATVDTGDERAAVLKQFPLSLRTQGYATARRSFELLDYSSDTRGAHSSLDFQTPYLLKLISSAPLSERAGYFFSMDLNQSMDISQWRLQDAWVRFGHDRILRVTLGQLNLSDMMHDRDTRLTVQDFWLYPMAKLDRSRGIKLDLAVEFSTLSIGLINGNGAGQIYQNNAVGLGRNHALFDNDSMKSVFTHFRLSQDQNKMGIFALYGEQARASGNFAELNSTQHSAMYMAGLDFSGNSMHRAYWYGQVLVSQWDNFINANHAYRWVGGFFGVDYISRDAFVLSLLYSVNKVGSFTNSNTIYRGLNLHSLTTTASYFLMHNLRLIVELNMDFLPLDELENSYVGHQAKEDYFLFGVDLSY